MLLAISLPTFSVTKTYQLCHDLDEILTSDSELLMVAADPLSGNIFAAPKTTSQYSVNCISLKEAEVLPETISIDAEILGIGRFTFSDNGNFKALHESSANRYWRGNGTTIYLGTSL